MKQISFGLLSATFLFISSGATLHAAAADSDVLGLVDSGLSLHFNDERGAYEDADTTEFYNFVKGYTKAPPVEESKCPEADKWQKYLDQCYANLREINTACTVDPAVHSKDRCKCWNDAEGDCSYSWTPDPTVRPSGGYCTRNGSGILGIWPSYECPSPRDNRNPRYEDPCWYQKQRLKQAKKDCEKNKSAATSTQNQ